MSWSLYVKNIPPEITEEKLIIYFQSSKSGGGDVDLDACKWNGDNAVVVFEEEECKYSQVLLTLNLHLTNIYV